MAKSRDSHRRHQQLMQELHLLNVRIRGYEAHIKKVKGKTTQHEWENLNRAIAALAGTSQAATVSTADFGLRNDLNDARRAIAMAEALLEVKEN